VVATSAVPKDGRAARSYRARLALADALLDLLNEGVERPTAAQIAERAGVSLRLVFHHFDDLEAIYASAGDLQLERVRTRSKPVDPALPFEDRVAAFLKIRARVFEYVSPVRRASIRLETSSAEISRRMRVAHQLARDHTLHAFAGEIAAAPAGQRAELATALDSATSWETWEFLRSRSELSVKQASRVVERIVRALLPGGT
jgi:TetR/AcrR family transcriptional regulator, regulator of autoinduction and epiphytic fitness